MTVAFSTSDVEPRERAAYWREVVVKDFARHNFRSDVGDDFRGKLCVDGLAEVVISTFDCDPCKVERTVGDIALCNNDDYVVGLQLGGTGVMSQDGRDAVLESGTFCLWDTRRPCALTLSEETRCMTVQIPRRLLDSRLSEIQRLTARVLTPSRPVNGLASGFLTMLPDRVGNLEAGDAAEIAEQVLDLLALAFSSESERKVSGLYAPRQIALMRLKAVIETRLREPGLSPATVAAAAGISPRYANQLLADIDTSVERYIVERRLDRCRRALESPTQSHRTVGDIAFSWGFTDLSHFGRRFKASYGRSPADYRRHHE